MKNQFLGFLLFVSITTVLAQAAPTKYAVLIGVDDYTRLVKLRYAKNDIEALRDELYKIDFAKENVRCLVCNSSEPQNLPTKENIEAAIESVLRRAKDGDVLFLAMNGHGIEAGGQARFCPLDTKEDTLLTTTIPIGDIFAAVEQCQATFKLMLVDACRDNPFASRNVAGASVLQTLSNPPKGTMLLQSCAKGELSYEDPELQRGVFTHYLIEGLQGKAADSNGKVTLMRLASYTIDKTQRRTQEKFQAKQRPYLQGEITDFVMSSPKTETTLKLPKPVTVPLIPDGRRVNVASVPQLLAAVENAQNGDVIALAPGTYSMSERIEICDEKKIVLYGDPRNPTNVKIRFGGKDTEGILIDNESHAKLIGLDISNGGYGIAATKDSRVFVLFCYIHNSAAFCGILGNGSSDVFAQNCVISGNNTDGICSLDGRMEVSNCLIYGNKECGISAPQYVCDVTVTDCEISQNGKTGIHVIGGHQFSGSGRGSFTTVIGCAIKDNQEYGIYMSSGDAGVEPYDIDVYTNFGGEFRNNTLSGNMKGNWFKLGPRNKTITRVDNTPNQ